MSGQLTIDRAPATGVPRGDGALPDPGLAPILEIMATTRAMRRLAPDPVPEETLRAVIEAATWAPTGTNAQGERFVLVTDRAVMARLAPLWRRVVDDYLVIASATLGGVWPSDALRVREALEYERDHFEEIPALVVVCYDNTDVARDRRNPKVIRTILREVGVRRFLRMSLAMGRFGRWSEAGSVYPAVQNLLLAARAHGLGACMTTWHLMAEADFKRVLGIPREVDTFAVVPMGWPVGSFGPVRRNPVETFIRRDGWSSRA